MLPNDLPRPVRDFIQDLRFLEERLDVSLGSIEFTDLRPADDPAAEVAIDFLDYGLQITWGAEANISSGHAQPGFVVFKADLSQDMTRSSITAAPSSIVTLDPAEAPARVFGLIMSEFAAYTLCERNQMQREQSTLEAESSRDAESRRDFSL